jgi:hypothetical protein
MVNRREWLALADMAHCEKSKNLNTQARTFTENILKEKGFEYGPSKPISCFSTCII